MASNDMHNKSLAELANDMRTGEYSSVELTQHYLDRIAKLDGTYNSFITVTAEQALAQAASADQRIKQGDAPLLCGIPIAHKDLFCTNGVRTSSASKMLDNFVPPYDATIVANYNAAGAVMLGKTNMDEFAMGSSTESSGYGPTRNPHDPERVPGGSSGGSAAAVASGMCLAALGSDTGGSIRQPAAHCGIVGMKGTYGSVSRHGLIALGSSLDQIGPFTNSVADAELIWNVMKGQDPLDGTSLDYSAVAETPNRKKIGVPRALIERDGIDADVLANFNAALEALKEAGYEVVDLDLSVLEYALAIYYIIMPAEASTNLARMDGMRYGHRSSAAADLFETYAFSRSEGFEAEVKRRILLGTYVLSAGYADAYYNKAMAARAHLIDSLEEAFKGVDVIATPTAPAPAFKLGEKVNDPLQMYLEDIFTVPANIAGVPALSVPSGFVEREGKALPVGFHIMAPRQAEDLLFAVGKDIEHALSR